MSYIFLFNSSLFVLVLLLIAWIYSEKKLDGKFSKIINWISFPFPLLALYAVFKLNIDFGYILVSITFLSLLLWFLGRAINLPSLIKEAKSFFIILLLITFFRSFLFEPFQIPSGSMLPQLEVGDFLVVNKFSYGLKNPIGNKTIFPIGSPNRGEVIVFTPKHSICSSNISDAYPDNLDKLTNLQLFTWQRLFDNCSSLGVKYVKRVIGLPGDEIIYKNGSFSINGAPLRKELIERNSNELILREFQNTKNYLIKQSLSEKRDLENIWIVPEDYYFVAGDNRDNSLDSRSWGFVSKEDITGKANFIWMHWECLGCFPQFSRNKFIE
ncbi:MAG: signal peptidase I [Flavobacteriaceae bacterium]|jgi:signal peptidase I|nr:signal peptidase I [Flavobacteriaceae bacterium]|tara:strand:+ start:13188 stop:14165 length:978 start_codon:yes stop_codon:yes gene_type:complete